MKAQVREHWEREVCGTRYADDAGDRRAYFADVDEARYQLEPMIKPFARFDDSAGKRVLEVGLGAGSDFIQWVRAGAVAYGRDLTDASVALVRERLALEGHAANVAVGDAEALEFPDAFFDIYYAWGVLHHSPNTERAIAEAARVLRPGGELRIMMYHYPSVSSLLIWLAQGLLRGRIIGPRTASSRYLESPGTKLFTGGQARAMVANYFRPESIVVRTFLAPGDLLTARLSQRYAGRLWRIAQRVYPRWFVRHLVGDRFGTYLTLTAVR